MINAPCGKFYIVSWIYVYRSVTEVASQTGILEYISFLCVVMILSMEKTDHHAIWRKWFFFLLVSIETKTEDESKTYE